VHGLNALHGRRRVIVRLEQPLARLVTPHFEVWKVNVDTAI
jgi:hypothetical protein